MSEHTPPLSAGENPASPPVLFSLRDRVATLQFNKPRQFNTLSEDTLDCLNEHLANIAANPDIAVVVLAAEGKAFCSGHDMKEMHANREQGFYERLLGKCSAMMQQLPALPQPVIAHPWSNGRWPPAPNRSN